MHAFSYVELVVLHCNVRVQAACSIAVLLHLPIVRVFICVKISEGRFLGACPPFLSVPASASEGGFSDVAAAIMALHSSVLRSALARSWPMAMALLGPVWYKPCANSVCVKGYTVTMI